jgi:RND family efflux transporter MFP subunit
MISIKQPARTFLLLAVALMVSCRPSDEKMRIKLNRKIVKSEEKITKHERKIAGFQQRMKMLADIDSSQISTGDERVVTTLLPRRKEFRKFIDIQGAVTSKKNIMVSSNTGGVLLSVPITEGQYVEQGQTLAVVNSDVLQANIREVEGRLELAEAVYERQKRLWEQNIGTELQFLEARNNKESLEKTLETLQVQLSDATVRAPISGTVDEVFGLQGQMVGPGSVIARIVNLRKVQVEAEIPESYVGVFRKGDKVEIYFQSLGITRSATIRAVGQVINPGNRTFKVEIDLPNTDGLLKPNLLATLRLKEYESRDNLIIPTRLIQDGSKGNFVFAVERDTVIKKWISIGESYDGESEVLEGLIGTEEIIDLGFRDVLEGEYVEVKEAS